MNLKEVMRRLHEQVKKAAAEEKRRMEMRDKQREDAIKKIQTVLRKIGSRKR